MSKYNFYKLKKDEHDWKIHTIPEGRKVPFKVMGKQGVVTRVEVIKNL